MVCYVGGNCLWLWSWQWCTTVRLPTGSKNSRRVLLSFNACMPLFVDSIIFMCNQQLILLLCFVLEYDAEQWWLNSAKFKIIDISGGFCTHWKFWIGFKLATLLLGFISVIDPDPSVVFVLLVRFCFFDTTLLTCGTAHPSCLYFSTN